LFKKNSVKIQSVIYDLEGSHEKHDNVTIFKIMLPVSKYHFHCSLTHENLEILINALQSSNMHYCDSCPCTSLHCIIKSVFVDWRPSLERQACAIILRNSQWKSVAPFLRSDWF